jgi:hypothetical protein
MDSAGDFDGDGRNDLTIGVPFEDISTVTNAGAINVIYGTARTGLNPGGIFPGRAPRPVLASGPGQYCRCRRAQRSFWLNPRQSGPRTRGGRGPIR